MENHSVLIEIRSTWIRRMSLELARGAGVREIFTDQLERFYDLLLQSVESGDPAWMDPILSDWANASSQTDLRDGIKTTSLILNKILLSTFSLAKEDLQGDQAMDLLEGVLPVFIYALERAASLQMDKHIAYISDELLKVQNKLERLDKSKSNFISVAAHELKTPLTLVEGYSTMVREVAQAGDPSKLLDQLIFGLNTGIQRLRVIINDMIDVSLIDNDLLSLNFQPVWINQTISLILGEVASSVRSRRLNLDLVAFPGSEIMFFGDPERIYQAFHNLISNAIKYTPDGGSITISGRELPGFLEVTVSDTGIGISRDDQELIFEKFGQLGDSRLHSSGRTKFQGGGPGLGLPIARGIIEAHGGRIWVESEGRDEQRNPGSIFHVLLPLRTEPPDPKIAKLFGVQTDQKN